MRPHLTQGESGTVQPYTYLHNDFFLFQQSIAGTLFTPPIHLDEEIHRPLIIPRFHIPGSDLMKKLPPAAQALYRGHITDRQKDYIVYSVGRPFIFNAIPSAALPAWQTLGQLDYLLCRVVEGDWTAYDAAQLRVNTTELPMHDAIIRDAYPASLEALPFLEHSPFLTESEKAHCDRAREQVARSAMLLPHYDGQFKLPEFLLPFSIPSAHITLERTFRRQ